jgi:hypothetical protein
MVPVQPRTAAVAASRLAESPERLMLMVNLRERVRCVKTPASGAVTLVIAPARAD